MNRALWRVVKQRYRDEALSGEGARKYGGRWTSAGQPVVYCSQHLSLAVLEILVHTQRTSMLSGYVQLSLEIPEELIESLDPSDLPGDWSEPFPGHQLQAIGDRWLNSGESLALEIPSAVLPEENNYLLNPRHPAFAHLGRPVTETLSLDPRLFMSRNA